MHRCEISAGRFTVSLMVLHHPEPYHVQIGSHHTVFSTDGKVVEEMPWVGNEQPFEGELCACELQFLNGIPGKTYPGVWEFTVQSLDTKPAKS